jgi:glycosyltransferase involved in cell wall biosynthesis
MSAIHRLLRLLDRYRVDVLHTHLYHAGVLAWAASGFRKVPVRVHTRHYELLVRRSGKPWDVLLDRRATRAADHVVAISEAVRRVLVDRERIPGGRVSVIYNGIDLPKNRRGPDRDAGPVRLIAVGSLSPSKGHRHLIEAMALIRRQIPQARLRIYGEGAERPALRQLVGALGLQDVIELPGFSAEIDGHLAESDLMVHPSLTEGFGISLLEGMAQACPIVASRVGGIPEIVADGISGILVPPGDPVRLAEAVTGLLCHRNSLRTMGAIGRQRLEQRFTLEEMLRSYAALYERLLVASVGRRGNQQP